MIINEKIVDISSKKFSNSELLAIFDYLLLNGMKVYTIMGYNTAHNERSLDSQ